ncbi:metallo-mystery pair system four-Cys motif protein [Hahella sp. CCB-MM4]|uniref:MbnP family copper-binding protein n=1 Tax=Hahella sp. (strain CCB-MM4) TaxID=1926491 RepID=UPI000B9B380B|nr:MbnP family copper-binding protein [Hahella sp. CCB-MM4]OZG72439.1 metallo-mystery pair system four-Cys motif protein [Hahella sp. CCB-MM4]
MKKFMAFFACTLLPITGCGGGGSTSTSNDEPSADHSASVTVNIPFEASANNIPIDCDTVLTGLGIAGTDASLKDFRFYLHDIEVTTDASRTLPVTLDTSIWQSNGVALLDFQNKSDSCSGDAKETHKSISGKVKLKAGESITGIGFKIGLPSNLNHQNPTDAVSPMNIPGLSWGWQAGHKFMRLDIAPVGGITRPTDGNYNGTSWNFHLGSTNCTGTPALGEEVVCGRSNRPEVNLNDFTLGKDTIVVDYSALVANANLGQDEGGAGGCMSGSTDPECAAIFTALGLDLAEGSSIRTPAQTVFRLK